MRPAELAAALGLRKAASFSFLSGVLDPALQFSRLGNATQVGSTGQVEWAPCNMVTTSAPGPAVPGWGVVLASWGAGPVSPVAGQSAKIITSAGASTITSSEDGGASCGSFSIQQGVLMRFSFYAKAAEVSAVRIRENVSSGARALVSLVNGAVSQEVGAGTVNGMLVTATDAGDGWWRITCRRLTTAATWRVSIKPGLDTGDGVSGVYIAGAQLEPDAGVDRPLLATSGTARYAPRFEYDPVSLLPLGLLLEEQRSNELPYSEDISQSSWLINACDKAAGLSGSPAGTQTVGKVTEHTSAAHHAINAAIAAPVSSQVYTVSVYVKAAERSFAALQVNTTGTTSPAGAVIYDLSTGAYQVNFDSGLSIVNVFSLPAPAGYRRVGFSFTSPASCTVVTAYVGPALNISTRTYAGTLGSGVLVWGAQLEKGTHATSYVPTYSSAATRAAETCWTSGTGWLNNAGRAGTLFVESTMPFPATTNVWPTLAAVSDGTSSNRIFLYLAGNTGSNWTYVATGDTGGVRDVQTLTAPSSVAFGSVMRGALAYENNNVRVCASGGAVAQDTSFVVPALDRLIIGSNSTSGAIAARHVRRVDYYPSALTDSQLQRLSA